MRDLHGTIRNAIRGVRDPAKLVYVVLLHWEGDENGGMDQFMKEAPKSELIGVDAVNSAQCHRVWAC